MYHNDFSPRSPNLGRQYESAALVARLQYEDRLRCAGDAYRLHVAAVTMGTQISLIARFGAALVRWGERLQTVGVAVSPTCSLDAQV